MLFAKRRLLCAWHCAFIICCYADSRDLHSFPTRRSSDLRETGTLPEAGMQSRPDQGALLTILARLVRDRKSTRLNSSHTVISYAVFCLKKKSRALTINGESYTVVGVMPHLVHLPCYENHN